MACLARWRWQATSRHPALRIDRRRVSTAPDAPGPRPIARCRFAPSPTGQLHLGSLRTALFNVLMVRSSAPGSSFILRIDDTDRNRYVEGATESLTRTLRWAGLEWDEGPDKDSEVGPFLQSLRLPLYQRYVDKLLQSGQAYRDFRPPSTDESGAQAGARLAAYLPPSEDEAHEMISAGKPFVVRLKMPERAISFEDLVFGKMTLNPKDLGNDPILLKSDGWPTYHLANAVDDVEMKITHVFRGEEWLPSVGKHLALFDALGAEPPRFAHLPLLINPDGSKLSKRSGDAHVQAYIDRGYEPEALINFVGLMGYNHHLSGTQAAAVEEGDHAEVMDLNALIRAFDVKRIARSRATPFFPKLDFLNRQHIRHIIGDTQDQPSPSPAAHRRQQVLARARDELVGSFGRQADLPDDELVEVVKVIGERATTVKDLPEEARVLFELPDWSAEPARKLLAGIKNDKKLPPGANVEALMKAVLERYMSELELAPPGQAHNDPMTRVVPAVLSSLNGAEGTKAGDGQWKAKTISTLAKKTLRWAVSGGKPGPAVAELLPIMGSQKMLSRLQAALDVLERSLKTVDAESGPFNQ